MSSRFCLLWKWLAVKLYQWKLICEIIYTHKNQKPAKEYARFSGLFLKQGKQEYFHTIVKRRCEELEVKLTFFS